MAHVRHGSSPEAVVQRLWLARSDTPGDGLLCAISRLPRAHHDFGFAPRVPVVLRPPTDLEGPRRAILTQAFGLTATEVDVAIHLGEGRSRDEIAKLRAVSVQTVTTHIGRSSENARYRARRRSWRSSTAYCDEGASATLR